MNLRWEVARVTHHNHGDSDVKDVDGVKDMSIWRGAIPCCRSPCGVEGPLGDRESEVGERAERL